MRTHTEMTNPHEVLDKKCKRVHASRSHHTIQERRTFKVDAGERGVDLQRLRNSDAALHAKIVACARERRKRNMRTTSARAQCHAIRGRREGRRHCNLRGPVEVADNSFKCYRRLDGAEARPLLT